MEFMKTSLFRNLGEESPSLSPLTILAPSKLRFIFTRVVGSVRQNPFENFVGQQSCTHDNARIVLNVP